MTGDGVTPLATGSLRADGERSSGERDTSLLIEMKRPEVTSLYFLRSELYTIL